MGAITNEEIFDEELCGMVKFEDETKEKPSEENDVTTENHKTETKQKKKEVNLSMRNMSRLRTLGLIVLKLSALHNSFSLPGLNTLCSTGFRQGRWNFPLRCPA